MTMTKERIEAIADGRGFDWEDLKALCELALRGLELDKENETLDTVASERLIEIFGLRAENERLQRERDDARELAESRLAVLNALVDEGKRARAKALDVALTVIRAQKEAFAQPNYAGGPMGAVGEIFACNQIERAILALREKP